MKNLTLKLLYSLLIIPLFFLASLTLTQTSPIQLVKNACATSTCWGSACNSDPYYQTCPRPPHLAIAGPIYSSDITVIVANSGSAQIPDGQQMYISIVPSNGIPACVDVTCLNREIVDYPVTWHGPGSITPTFDTLGCSLSGTCTNSYLVKVRFAGTVLDTSLNCPNPDHPITLINDTTQSVTFDLGCSKPQPTCLPTDQQQCQQNTGTTSGCVAGWHPNPDTTKTCDQTGGLNTCCIKDVCTKPTQPTNVRVTCSGCQ